MAQVQAPDVFRQGNQIVDPRTGMPTSAFADYLNQLWNQLAAGLPPVPCLVEISANLITLTPKLHENGGQAYLDNLIFMDRANGGSTAAVTARVKSPTGYLATVNVYLANGVTQAGNLDVAANAFYFFCFVQALNGGAGGLILK